MQETDLIPLWDKDFNKESMNIPWVESPFFNDILIEKKLTKTEVSIAKEYNENGYIILENLNISDEILTGIKTDCSPLLGFNPTTKKFRDTRIQDAFKISKNVKALACLEQILNILELLYGRKPIPFQTLNFPMATEQGAHSDCIHFSSLPKNYMCGVWIALEDITLENGPVFYFPKSHKLAEYSLTDISNIQDGWNYQNYENFIINLMKSKNLTPKFLTLKKGSALIWSANLVHGGSLQKNKQLTRWSQVTHYFFEDCIYYTPLNSLVPFGQYFVRNNLSNIINGEKIKLNYNKYDIKLNKGFSGMSTIFLKNQIQNIIKRTWLRVKYKINSI